MVCCAGHFSTSHGLAEPTIPLMKSRRRIISRSPRDCADDDAIRAGIYDGWNGHQQLLCRAENPWPKCLHGVIKRHLVVFGRCALYPPNSGHQAVIAECRLSVNPDQVRRVDNPIKLPLPVPQCGFASRGRRSVRRGHLGGLFLGSGALTKQGQESLLRHRLAEEKTLTVIATHTDQGRGIGRFLDADRYSL
jgi:hypothetical protein